MIDFKPKATSTIQFTPKSVQPIGIMPQLKQDGFLETVAKNVVSPFARLGVNAVKAGQMIAGQKVDPAKPMNVPWLGQVKPVGQEGSFGRRVLDAVGVGTEVAANVIPTTAPARAVVPLAKATIKGAVMQGLKTGARSGLVTGALYGAGKELQNPEATAGSVLRNTALGGVTGGITGGVIGGALPLPVAAVKGITNAVKPTKIMQRVARVHALDQQKFQQTAKESIGDYLVKRGIYGNDEQIMTQLAERFQKSKDLADSEIAKLGGQWKAAPIRTALQDLAGRESRISTPGAPSKDFARVTELLRKHDSVGLTMTEVNEAKRLFERNVKLDFLKTVNPEGVARANTIDDAIRTWQFETAEKMGLNNLPEINKETQLAKMLGDALFKKNARADGNNAFGLSDIILLSGGDPAALSMFISKRMLESKQLRSLVAKTIAGKPTVGQPKASTRAPINDKSRLLPSGDVGGVPNIINLTRGADPSGVRLVPAQPATKELLALPPGNPARDYSINQGRAIPVAPNGRSILFPKAGVQVGGDAATAQPKFGKPTQPVRPYELYTPDNQLPTIQVGPKPKNPALKNAIPTSKLTPPKVFSPSDLGRQVSPQSQPKSVLPKPAYSDVIPPNRNKTTSVIPQAKNKAQRSAFGGFAGFEPVKTIKRTDGKPRPETDQKYEVLTKEVIPPESLEVLIQEARKYKSAEEFVKSQGKPLYHGSPYMNRINIEGFKLGRSENLANAWGRGVYFAENKRLAQGYSGLTDKGGGIVEAYIPKDLKLYKAKAKDAYMLKNEELIKKGYGGVIAETGGGNTTITVFDPSVIKTRSQLTDIWNQANKPSYLNEMLNKAKTEGERGFVKLPFSGKTVKAIDALTKKELIDTAAYIRSNTYNEAKQYTLDTLAKKYEINTESGDKKLILKQINALLNKTKTPETLPGTRKKL